MKECVVVLTYLHISTTCLPDSRRCEIGARMSVRAGLLNTKRFERGGQRLAVKDRVHALDHIARHFEE